MTEALEEKLAHSREPSDQPWVTAFGKLRRLRKGNGTINRIVEEEFERVDAEAPVAWKALTFLVTTVMP